MFFQGVNHFYGIMGAELSYGNFKHPPRSSGLARMSLLIFSFISITYILNENLPKKIKFILLVLIYFFATTTLLFHSRTISFIYILINLVFIICYYKKYFLRKKIILFALVLPILTNAVYNFYLYELNIGKNWLINSNNILLSSVIRDQNNWNKPRSLNQYSSGRYENWKKTINKINTKPLVGYGAQSDRIYIQQSVRNALLYLFVRRYTKWCVYMLFFIFVL